MAMIPARAVQQMRSVLWTLKGLRPDERKFRAHPLSEGFLCGLFRIGYLDHKMVASFPHRLDRCSSLDKISEPVIISSAAINQKRIMRCKEICESNNRRLCIAA